ncbi:MAG: hypothetical protein AABW83_03250 [Nanoarchaeota archaeon]
MANNDSKKVYQIVYNSLENLNNTRKYARYFSLDRILFKIKAELIYNDNSNNGLAIDNFCSRGEVSDCLESLVSEGKAEKIMIEIGVSKGNIFPVYRIRK